MHGLAENTLRQSPLLAANLTVRHRLTEASNLHYPGQRDERATRWRGMSRSEHIDVAHALVHQLGAHLDGYALTGGEPALNRPALMELVDYLATAPVREFWLETNATVISGPMLEDLREAGLRLIRVHLPSREPRAYARALSIPVSDAEEHLARVEATVNTAIELGIHVSVDLPIVRGVNDNADNLLGFAPWYDRGLPLTVVQLEHGSRPRDPLELLQSLGARPLALDEGEHLYELCHDSRCITLAARPRQTTHGTTSLHVAADGRVHAETHDPSPLAFEPPSSANDSLDEPAPDTLRVVSPELPWGRIAAGF
jgi:pyruvate-formate lyase-activating enzyme